MNDRLLAALAVIAGAVIFYRLGEPAIYWWDEARIASNSLEMTNPLVVTFNGAPDFWNTKPPLAIWLNALSMALFGANEWALRLPSALAAFATVLVVYDFAKRQAGEWAGFLAGLILLGIGGFIEVHVSRTADFDSLLVLWLTLTAFSLHDRRIRLAALFFFLALMTKGAAALLMAPGFAFLAWRQWRSAIIPGAVVAVAFAGFMLAREAATPGYLSAMWANDFGRFSGAAEAHIAGSPTYYLGIFAPWQQKLLVPWEEIPYIRSAFPWIWFVAFRSRLLPVLVAFLVMASLAETRLAWYVAPAYPLVAVLSAIALVKVPRFYPMFLAVLCIGCNFWKIDKELDTRFTSVEQRLPNAVRHIKGGTVKRDWHSIVDGEIYDGPIAFYSRINGFEIR